MLGFNDNIFTLARRSTDQAVRAKAIDRLAPWGGTALYDVVIRALDLLGRQIGRRALARVHRRRRSVEPRRRCRR